MNNYKIGFILCMIVAGCCFCYLLGSMTCGSLSNAWVGFIIGGASFVGVLKLGELNAKQVNANKNKLI